MSGKQFLVSNDPTSGKRTKVKTPNMTKWYLDGNLHREDGPAVETHLGTRFWYWKGVNVPRWVIEDPRSKTPLEIIEIKNAEVRRAAMESFGLEDLLIDLGKAKKAKIRHQTKEPWRRLWEIFVEDSDGEHAVYVEVKCPTKGSRYFLRVPPDQHECHAAVAWTFRRSAEEYHPDSES